MDDVRFRAIDLLSPRRRSFWVTDSRERLDVGQGNTSVRADHSWQVADAWRVDREEARPAWVRQKREAILILALSSYSTDLSFTPKCYFLL